MVREIKTAHAMGVFEIFYEKLPPRLTVLVAGFASVLMLAGAHAFERIGGLAPCLLCLEQREVHWTALAVVAATLAAAVITKSERLVASGLGGLAMVFLFSAFLAGFHAGVEWSFWPGPEACAAGGQNAEITGADMLQSLNGPGMVSGPPCSVAAWRFLGISMAGYNALFSAALSALCACAAFSAWRVGFCGHQQAEQTA